MKILIVDDDPAILSITAKLITMLGHEVVCCENALDAIQTLGDLTYDILITDATMPAHSGFDLIRTIGKRQELSYLTIAMLTGRSEKSDIELALELGVQDYIVKPIDPQLFMDKVEKLVERHKKKKKQKPSLTKSNGVMNVPIQILRMTDMGVSIESPYPLAKGTVVTIDLPELKDVGLKQNRFKAIFNSEATQGKPVMTELVLLDLNEAEQTLLSKVAKKWNAPKAS